MAGMAVVYSYDCPAGLERVAADATYVWECDGTADDVQINAAIDAVAATGQTSSAPPTGGGGSVLLVGNTFKTASPVQMQSWVDVGGALGRAGCVIEPQSGFSGTAYVTLAETYTERCTLHDLRINGSADTTSGADGIYWQGQVTQTPYSYSDPYCALRNLTVSYANGQGIFLDNALRSTIMHGIRVEGSQSHDFHLSAPDSCYSNLISLGAGQAEAAGCGFYMDGTDILCSNLMANNSHLYGFYQIGTRQSYSSCKSEDSWEHGWYLDYGKCQLSACSSNSANLNSSGTYSGFYINAVTDLTMFACQSYDRNTTPHQSYGVYFNGSSTYSRVYVNTYNNVSGSAGGTTTPGTGSVYDVYGS